MQFKIANSERSYNQLLWILFQHIDFHKFCASVIHYFTKCLTIETQLVCIKACNQKYQCDVFGQDWYQNWASHNFNLQLVQASMVWVWTLTIVVQCQNLQTFWHQQEKDDTGWRQYEKLGRELQPVVHDKWRSEHSFNGRGHNERVLWPQSSPYV